MFIKSKYFYGNEVSDTMKTQNKGTFMMLEKGDHRYEFFTRPVKESNVSDKIAYYEPIVRHCERLICGSTYNDRRVSVEGGNNFYKELLTKGYKKVQERSFA